ncbi:MAG TPA: IS3 family transposase [Candidatus Angelobacter sp.]
MPGQAFGADSLRNNEARSSTAQLLPHKTARAYSTLEQLADHMQEFIEQIYNRVRLHSALAYQSPLEFECQRILNKAQADWRPAKMSFPRHREIYSDGSNH